MNANCTNAGPNHKECSCNVGFKGDGKSCMPTNACMKGNGGCDPQSSCMPFGKSDSVKCICNFGYQGVGRFCEPINVCKPGANGTKTAASCDKNARCTKTGPGTRSCKCNRFFEGDGTVCNPINYCGSAMPVVRKTADQMPCHKDARCSAMKEGMSCACNSGFSGDGRKCEVDEATDCARRLTKDALLVCDGNARCMLRGETQRCVCRDGYVGEGTVNGGCTMKDRCQANTHNCHMHAHCNNTGPGKDTSLSLSLFALN